MKVIRQLFVDDMKRILQQLDYRPYCFGFGVAALHFQLVQRAGMLGRVQQHQQPKGCGGE